MYIIIQLQKKWGILKKPTNEIKLNPTDYLINPKEGIKGEAKKQKRDKDITNRK